MDIKLIKQAYKLGYQAGLCSTSARLKKQASDNEEKPISELKDGVYSGRRYGYTFELNTGEKYKTPTGTRCTREHCGGVQMYRVNNGNVIPPISMEHLKDGNYKAIRYLDIYELEDGRLFRDPDEVYVKQNRNIALRGGYKSITVQGGRVVDIEAKVRLRSRGEKKASADVLANKYSDMLYHASPHELDLLDGAKTRHAPGFVFVSPSKHHASLFALNRRKIVDALKQRIGNAIKVKNLSYGQWADEPSDKALDVADVYVESDKPFKPFSGKQKGYVYSINSEPYRDKIKKWDYDNGDRELLIEGKVKPDLREEIAIKYNVHPGKAP